jgi:ABC-type polar amino acid transport system ATPase subunit
MAKDGNDDLFATLRARGLRKNVAKTVSKALGPGGGDSKAKAVARDVATDLRKAANEIEDRVSGGPKKRSAAARKAAQTRKRNAAQRSATARKAARTRAQKT